MTGEERTGRRLLIVSQYFYPESFRINDIASEWVRRGYRVTVLTGIPNYPQGRFYQGYSWFRRRREVWNGVEIVRIPLFPRGRSAIGLVCNYLSFVVSGRLWNLTAKGGADLVFSFETSPMTQVLIGCGYSRKHRVPHFLYAQDLWPDNVEVVAGIHHPLILRPIDRMVDRIYRNTDRIFVTSPSFVDAIVQRRHPVPADKVIFWPQYAEEFYRPLDRAEVRRRAADDPLSPVRLLPDDGSFKVIFTGNIGYAQGLHILPEAAERLKAKSSAGADGGAIRFVVVGDGRYREQLEREAASRGVEECFTMIPRQPAERIPELLACCDAAFLSFMDTPLFEKTIPAKLQSYMACAMPILAAARGETERIVREAACGVCVPIGDAEALADAAIRLRALAAEQPEDFRRMGEYGSAYCAAHFDKKLRMDQMDEWIQAACGG